MTIDTLKQYVMDTRDDLEYCQERESLNSQASRRRAVRCAAARFQLAKARLYAAEGNNDAAKR